jgi:hypothetical protein
MLHVRGGKPDALPRHRRRPSRRGAGSRRAARAGAAGEPGAPRRSVAGASLGQEAMKETQEQALPHRRRDGSGRRAVPAAYRRIAGRSPPG